MCKDKSEKNGLAETFQQLLNNQVVVESQIKCLIEILLNPAQQGSWLRLHEQNMKSQNRHPITGEITR